ncbi:MAG: T9SS type A sorting domain-containing protein [bacterium]
MKKYLTVIALIVLSKSFLAQTPIKNFSFENWTTNSENLLVPSGWETYEEDVESNAVKKFLYGSEGSSALMLGSHVEDGEVVGSDIYIEDVEISTLPASLSFDYIVQHNNVSKENVFGVDITFYDSNNRIVYDYGWESGILTNNSTFKSATIHFHKDSIVNAVKFDIDIFYDNYHGSIDEYAVVDNIRFNTTKNTQSLFSGNSSVNIYPNPTTGLLSYMVDEDASVAQVIVTSIDGKQTTFKPNFTNSIDISAFPAGVYSVSFLNEQNAIIGRNKVVLTK